MLWNIKDVIDCIVCDVVILCSLLNSKRVDFFQYIFNLFKECNKSFACILSLDQRIALKIGFALEANFRVDDVQPFVDILSTLHL
jgi:hypothetical protein